MGFSKWVECKKLLVSLKEYVLIKRICQISLFLVRGINLDNILPLCLVVARTQGGRVNLEKRGRAYRIQEECCKSLYTLIVNSIVKIYSSQKYMCSFDRTFWLTILTNGQTFYFVFV